MRPVLPDIKTVQLLVDHFVATYVDDWPFGTPPETRVEEYKDLTELCVRRLIHMMARVAYESLEEIKYPATWIEALKERFLPAWAKVRWPVRYVVVDIRAYYPRIQIPEQKPFIRLYRTAEPLSLART